MSRVITFGSLFAGIGGFDLGFERAGMSCSWQVEKDEFCRKVLAKHWPKTPRFPDVKTFPPWEDDFGHEGYTVDVIRGGFPCQPVSVAGKGRGKNDDRWLWPDFARIICDLEPRYAVLENVPGLLGRGMDTVLGDLAECGYSAEWKVLSACGFGAPHVRKRLFIIAHRDKVRRWCFEQCDEPFNEMAGRLDAWEASPKGQTWEAVERWAREIMDSGDWGTDASESGRMDDGVSRRLDRIGACGNAVVPQIAEHLGILIVRHFHDHR